MSRKPATPAEIVRLRLAMDQLNAELVEMLQRRARLARRIGRRKAHFDLPAADPRRERAMLAKLLRGTSDGFERAELERLLRAIFRASRALVVRDRRRRVE